MLELMLKSLEKRHMIAMMAGGGQRRGLSSVCLNGHEVFGKFAEESHALTSALALKRRFRSANVSVRDEDSGVHFCVALPPDRHLQS